MSQNIQVSLPKQDDFTGGWTPTKVADHTRGGSSVSSAVNPHPDAFKVFMSGVAWPKSGPEVLTVIMAGDGNTTVTIVLFQDSNAIAAATFVPGSSSQPYLMTLTPAQIALITNYAKLHVEVIAGDVLVTCCVNPVPALLTATVTGGGVCNGIYPIVWLPDHNAWGCSLPLGTCHSISTMALICSVLEWTLLCGPGTTSLVSSSCGPPFTATFTADLHLCGGTSNATITFTVP